MTMFYAAAAIGLAIGGTFTLLAGDLIDGTILVGLSTAIWGIGELLHEQQQTR